MTDRYAPRYPNLVDVARDYYALCDAAEDFGIPVSLADPRSPNTVTALAYAVEVERNAPHERVQHAVDYRG